MRILVVEDDALVGFILKTELAEAGHEVAGPAGTADEALRLAEATAPAVALVNINLADGGDGVEVARVLRERFGTICLFVSGAMSRAHAARDVAIGYIAKPSRPETVLAAIEVAKAFMEGKDLGKVTHGLELFRDASAQWRDWIGAERRMPGVSPDC